MNSMMILEEDKTRLNTNQLSWSSASELMDE